MMVSADGLPPVGNLRGATGPPEHSRLAHPQGRNEVEKPAWACARRRTGEDKEPEVPTGGASWAGLIEQWWTRQAGGRYEWATMETADITTLWPRWMVTAGMMAQLRVQVRRRCCRCGALIRVEPAEIAAREGANCSLIDRLERCAMVGCAGSTAYLASRTYGRAWTLLLRDPRLIETFEPSSAQGDARIG